MTDDLEPRPSEEPFVDPEATLDERPPVEQEPPRDRPTLRPLDLLVLALVTVAVFAVHFVRLGEPHDLLPLDENHYVPDSLSVLDFGTESDVRVPGERRVLGRSFGDGAFVVHPPVGKQLIALGMAIFGKTPFGWRFSAALFGSLASLVIYALARRLWPSPWAAAGAALLLGVDGLWFVQSRAAMLDIFQAFFVLLGVWLLVEDRDRARADQRSPRWWRLGAGCAFGLALASKWSAAPFLLVALALALAWELRKARALEEPRRIRRAGGVLAVLVALPVGVYLLTYLPWLLNENRYAPCETNAAAIVRLGCYHQEMLEFHRNLEKFEVKEETPTPSPGTGGGDQTAAADDADVVEKTEPGHPYFGDAWTWPWIGRPVVHYYETPGGRKDLAEEVIGLPNPAIWWPAFAAFPFLAVWAFRRDRVAALLFAMFCAGYLPYLAADLVSRPVFLFYATPLVPFLVLTVVHVLTRVVGRWPDARWLPIGYVALAVLVFAYFYPVLAAHPIPRDGILGWVKHMWFQLDCSAVGKIKRFCWI